MSITGIVIAAVIVGGTGLFIGAFLGLAGKKFAVETDEREEAIIEVLPGNCGGCGYLWLFSESRQCDCKRRGRDKRLSGWRSSRGGGNR